MMGPSMIASSRAVRRRWSVACGVVGSLAMLAGACGGARSPVAPTPPVIVPPVVVNTPPTIESINISRNRVEAGEEVDVTAVVTDAETPIDQLTYTWSAGPVNGTFTGTGSVVKWRAPTGQATPAVYTLALAVTEKYTSSGEVRENSVVSAPASVHYNDSFAEVGALATQFLIDFVTFSVGPAEAVRNFSDNCSGKQDEYDDIEDNRKNLTILGGSFGPQRISFNASRTTGEVSESCTFWDIVNATQVRRTAVGTCLMTTVYEDWRWLLCSSRFNDGQTTSNTLKYDRR
jgi:hypothetical protein